MKSQIMTDLREGKTIEFEGLFFKKKEGELQPGDIYFAQRNTEPKFLIVSYVKYFEIEGITYPDFVVPTTIDYPYNYNECIKVEWVEFPENER